MSNLFRDVLNGDIETESTKEKSLIEEEYITEATYPDSIPYMKLMNRSITLPIGKSVGRGNICFLYTDNVNQSIELMNRKDTFIPKTNYPYYFMTPNYRGKVYNRNYNIRMGEERSAVYNQVKTKTHIRPYPGMTIKTNEERSTFFDLSQYINIFNTMLPKVSIARRISLYWSYFNSIWSKDYGKLSNKFVLINADYFPIKGKTIYENLQNPIYLMYYTLYKYSKEELLNFDMDFYIFSGLHCFKFNPSKVDYSKSPASTFKIIMKRLYSFTPHNNETIIDNMTDDKVIKKEEAMDLAEDNVKNKVVSPVKEEEKPTVTELKQVKKEDSNVTTKKTTVVNVTPSEKKSEEVTDKEIEKKISDKAATAKKEIEQIPNIESLPTEKIADAIETNTMNAINDDKELLTRIYNQMRMKSVPAKSPASSARDAQLREAQKDIKIGNLTIQDIQKVNASTLTIPSKDISHSITTTNKNMDTVRFDNADRVYNEKVMPKDISNAILSLNNKSIPMYVRDIKVTDTSNELNYKDTYTISLEDTNRQRHTVKVDIPKCIDDKFLYVGGNKKLIKNQNFLLPVVKTGPDTVQVVTNYNKMFIRRVDNKSIGSIERFKKLIRMDDGVKSYFTIGNVFANNVPYVTTIEYDDFSKLFIKFTNEKSTIYFDQIDADKDMISKGLKAKRGYMYIGTDKNGKPIYVNTETQKTDDDKYIVDCILDAIPEEYLKKYSTIASPKRLMYAKVKVMDQDVPVITLLCFWEGLSRVLKKAQVNYRLESKKPDSLKSNEQYIQFADCYLVYEESVPVSLLMNGLRILSTQDIKIEEMDTSEPCLRYFTKVYGKSAIGNALMNFYEFTIDPITEEVLNDVNMPTDLVELMVYAVSLLSDNQHKLEIDQSLSRIRRNEIIPAILYEALAKNYINYRNSNGTKKYTIPRDIVIKNLMALKTVEDYSTLNPVLELEMTHSISAKGFRGANLDRAYTMPKRSYDPSMTGVIAPSTSPDGSVGINKTLSLEPRIKSIRGYVDVAENLDDCKDVNLFSPGELMIPLGADRDDASRLGHAIKQSKHVIPVQNSSPVLISNGMEEACRFHLSSDFAINADEDGTVVEYDPETKIMVVEYKSGKHRAINLGGQIVKNGGGGFFLSNVLTTTLKVGDKFKKDDVIAYHKDFFTNDKYNDCRMNMGTLAKVAIMSTYNTYQDATFITEKLANDAATEMCFVKQVTLGKNSNIEYMVHEGDHVMVGDSLIQFDTSYEDSDLNKLLANLSQDQKDNVLEGSRNNIHSKYSGVIEKINMYSTVSLDEMSPTMRKIFSKYYSSIRKKNNLLEKYDPESKDSIIKCGILCNETTGKIETSKFGTIKGAKVDDGVLIEFYVKHSEPLEIGSKIANFTALKNTIGEVIPEGYEPYSEFRPEEEISSIIASNSILKRMVPSILLTALGNKVLIELKRTLKDIYDKE